MSEEKRYRLFVIRYEGPAKQHFRIPNPQSPIPNPQSMNAIKLLTRSSGSDLTPEEDAQLTRELAAAYHMDEASATSREVQRIAEKIRARLDADALRTIDPPDEETGAAELLVG